MKLLDEGHSRHFFLLKKAHPVTWAFLFPNLSFLFTLSFKKLRLIQILNITENHAKSLHLPINCRHFADN